MLESIQDITKKFDGAVAEARTSAQLESVRIEYLGRKSGIITRLFEQLPMLKPEDKRLYGPALNGLKSHVEQTLTQAQAAVNASVTSEFDPTVPPLKSEQGHLHPITIVQKQIEDIFLGLGFDVRLGPEIETDYYNFEALNIPELHPARDMQDTFYIDEPLPKGERGKALLLRTQISNMQVRYMEQHKPPFSVILPGRVFRNESLDASHEHTYQYIEGMVVGDSITFGQMAWTLDYVFKELFGQDVKTKLLPSYFPFVEPGAEMAISCLICGGKGCSVCKQTGWVEILGCGMIHQKVFAAAGYPKNKYTGFAFGFGLSRIVLMKYQIPDIRLFAENDLRFLKQF